ncbi:MAG: diacylglycerol kinase [Methyloceanibacter sp.]|uniref:diacylglycerol kinase n=1 Tax=Methyloceanibacter sp. TaxID=1965321 RepID=UPI003D6D6DD8
MRAPRPTESAEYKHLHEQPALPGKGGLTRIGRAFWNTIGGFREGLRTEAAIKQEAAITLIALPVSFFVATNVWTWVALMGSLLLLLAVEFLNTAIERLCNHLHPEKHEAIKVTKDLASAGVFLTIALAAMVWIAAILARFGF